jgi:uncharacterized damage-inducible protein DinB
MDIEQLKYPIGKFHFDGNFDNDIKNEWIGAIEALPSKISDAVRNLTPDQLDTPYRPEGWTVRQVIHHVADSHMNSYIRFKLGLTEDNPTIKPYEENDWAKMEDSKLPIDISLKIIEGLHQRWVVVLKNMTMQDFERTVFHPGMAKNVSLKFLLCLYVWHGKHHTAHCGLVVGTLGC